MAGVIAHKGNSKIPKPIAMESANQTICKNQNVMAAKSVN
jgi:hypothetical protein